MSTATSFSKLGYVMLKKETTAGTAVYPDVAAEILSESIEMNWDFTASETIAGNRSLNLRPILNRVGPAEGTIEVLADPKTLGHWFTGLFGEGTDLTLNAGVAFQHDFESLNTLQTYTMDVKLGGEDYVKRFFGVRVASAEVGIEDNKLKLTFSFSAQRVFTNARVTTAVSSGTALELDQTSGLTTSDTITVFDQTDMSEHEDLTISSITDENNLVVSTISQSLAENDIVVIAAQTPSYDLGDEFIWSGGAEVYVGTGANGIQNLNAKTNVEDFTLTVTNELEPRWAATGIDVVDRMPANILLKGVSVEGSFSQFHTDPQMMDFLRSNEQLTLRVDFIGDAIDSNVAAAASATVETDGTDTLTVAVDTAGEAGNDYAIIFTTGNGSLTASLAGKLITVNLDATTSNNTTTAVAAAINGLSGVSCSDTGTDLVDTASNATKIEFSNGRDANEREKLRFDFENVRFQPFSPTLGNDDIINEEISFTAFSEEQTEREVKVRLRNTVADY